MTVTLTAARCTSPTSDIRSEHSDTPILYTAHVLHMSNGKIKVRQMASFTVIIFFRSSRGKCELFPPCSGVWSPSVELGLPLLDFRRFRVCSNSLS